MSLPSRICPQCQKRTEAALCADDGYNTVEARRYLGNTTESLVGRVFDERYRVEALIGLGGMGAVYRARQLSMDRLVALKILRPQFASNLEQVRRFQTEARAASSLDHPNTIKVFDFGQSEDGELYLVCELLEGEPLSMLLERCGRLDPGRAATIAAQILKSLSEAHANGIIHRDLKPENIFLKTVHGEHDFVKVLDFGIAKVAAKGMEGKRLTTTGTVVGTPLYMSPEQARGQSVGVASDIYAVGAVLYEMLAGHPPFEGDSAMAVMMAHVQSPLAPLHFDSPEPALRGMSDLVSRCLEKAPEARPPSADRVREILEDFLWDYDVEAVDRADSAEVSVALADQATIGGESQLSVERVLPTTASDAYPGSSMTMMAAEVAGLQPRRWPWLAAAAALFMGVVGVIAVNSGPRTAKSPKVPVAAPSIKAAGPAVPSPEVAQPPTTLGVDARALESEARRTRQSLSGPLELAARPTPEATPTQPKRPRPERNPRPKPQLRVDKK